MKPQESLALRAARQGLLFVACGWTVVWLLFAVFAFTAAKHTALDMARVNAENSIQKDITYRQWVALHGGVYVPVTKKTPPNPFLADWPQRDAATASGRKLTLVNPAYMTRQVHEWFKTQYGVIGHVTSLKPINPANAADAWETAALKELEKGAKEIVSIEAVNGTPALRFMRPLVTEKSCLKCHEAQSYKEGDVRGGISVAVPLKPYFTATAASRDNAWLWGGGIWVLGLLGLRISYRRMSQMIRQREESAEQLREMQSRLQLLHDSMLEGMALHEIVCDASGQPCDYRFLQVNPAFERLTGLKATDIIGKTVRDIFPNFDRKWIARYGPVALNGEPCEFEDYSSDLGRHFHVAAFCPRKGQFAVTFSDITERKKAEEALRHSRAAALNIMEDAVAARQRAEQAGEEVRRLNQTLEERVHDRTAELEASNKEMEAFSYSVSHDLRAPLRAINGFATILSQEHAGQLDDEGRRTLGIVCAEALRMGQLIDDLLEFSRIGRQTMQQVEIDMTAVARRVFDECATQAPGRDIRLNLPPLPPTMGDPALIPHIWTNLLSNAIKYTRPRPVAEIEITGWVDGDSVVYCVRDNGVGFDMTYVDRLFGVFQRLHSDTEFEGTGVGLALAHRIITRHGGRVWAEARLNEGAAFYFTLPAGNG